MMEKVLASLLLLVLVGSGVWDTLVALRAVEGEYVSEVLRRWGYNVPVLVLLLGVLLGHLFWSK